MNHRKIWPLAAVATLALAALVGAGFLIHYNSHDVACARYLDRAQVEADAMVSDHDHLQAHREAAEAELAAYERKGC